jgi:hypothetical protein
MNRTVIAGRALLLVALITSLVMFPAGAQVLDHPYIPMGGPPAFANPPAPTCCVPEAITPPAKLGCNTPCSGSANCSGEVKASSYFLARCEEMESGEGTCVRSAHTVFVPEWVCMAMECQINGEPGVQCRWIYLFGGGYSGIGLDCSSGSTICD